MSKARAVFQVPLSINRPRNLLFLFFIRYNFPSPPLRGRPFDSEGGLVLFGNKYSDLENAGNKNLSSSGKKMNNLTLTC